MCAHRGDRVQTRRIRSVKAVATTGCRASFPAGFLADRASQYSSPILAYGWEIFTFGISVIGYALTRPHINGPFERNRLSESIGLFIVDDNRLLREGLVSMLSAVEGFHVVGAAASGAQAQLRIREVPPTVALIDIGLPDGDGIDVTRALRRDVPDVKVIILGMPDLADEIMTCIEAGAVGYVLKEASFDYLVDTIRSAHRGESFCSPRIAASLFSRVAELSGGMESESDVQLTPREVEVVNRIAEGLSNKQIAEKLFIEVQTVKNHVHNILDKLQLHNRLEAVRYARQKNLLDRKRS